MNDACLEAPTSEELTTEHLAAGADRRFYAFVVDCLARVGRDRRRGVRRLHAAHRAGPPLDRGGGDRRHRAAGLAARLAAGRHLRPDARQGPGRAAGAVLRGRPADRPAAGDAADPGARRGDAADPRLRCGRPGLDGDGRPQRLAPRLARPADRLGGRRRTPGPGGRGARGGGAAPGRQPHRDAAGPGVADAARGGSRRAGKRPPDAAARGRRAARPADGHAAAGPGLAAGRGGPGRRAAPPRPPSAGRARARRRQLRRATAPSRARPTPPRRRCGGRSPSTPASSSRCAA